MQYKSQAGESLIVVTRDIGVQNTLVSDNTEEQTGPHIDLQEFIRCCFIGDSKKEQYSPWQSISEEMIKLLKDKANCRRIWRRVPKRIRDFVLFLEAEIYSRMAGNIGEPLWKY